MATSTAETAIPLPTPQAVAPSTDVQLHSQESEQLIIGFILAVMSGGNSLSRDAGTTVRQALDLLAVEDFNFEIHCNARSILGELNERSLSMDLTSVLDLAERRQADVGGRAYLGQLATTPVYANATDASFLAAVKRVKELSMMRKLQAHLIQARALISAGLGFDRVRQTLSDSLADLERAANSAQTGPQHLSSYAVQVIDDLSNPEPQANIQQACPTGFTGVDNIIIGLNNNDLILLAARPSMGKTALALNVAKNVAAIYQRPALIFSLEMSGAALTRRMVSSHSSVHFMRLRTNELQDHDWSRLSDALEDMAKIPIYIDETPGLTLSQIRSRARTFAAKYPHPIIIVDYLQFVSDDGSASRDKRNNHVSSVSRGFKDMARELRSPVLALSQLNRELENRANKRPMLSDLRESGSLEQDADVVMFLYRDDYYNRDSKTPGITEVIVAKQRDGPTGTALLTFEKDIVKFHDASLPSETRHH